VGQIGRQRTRNLFPVQRVDGKFTFKEEYWSNALNNRHGGVILVGDTLFGDRDDSCQLWAASMKDGKNKWTLEPTQGRGSASPTYADGLLYVRVANGWVALVNPGSGKEISTFKLPNGSRDCWAHPVVAGGKFYLREQSTLWCYDVKAK
jgi:outer membrane protein assembly factor BamB